MNMVWNNAAWNGLLFDRAWIFAGAGAAAAAVIVAVMALVVGRAVRSRPAPVRYGLLLAGLVVVGIVPAVAAASRMAGRAFVTVPVAAVDRPLAVGAVVAMTTARRPPRPAASAADADFSPPDHVEETAVASLRMPTFREVASCLLWVWLWGLVFCVGVAIRDFVRLRRLWLSLVPCSSPAALGLLDEAARAVGLRTPPRLYESVAVPVPVVIGPLKPVVVLPVGMVNTLERDKLAAVLTHEVAHVVRGDLWVGLLQHAVAAIFWWCLPVHRLNRRLAEVREEICDDYVVVTQGDGFRLAEVLVEMAARLRGDRARLSIAALGAMDEKPALEGRVERLVYRTARSVPMTRMNQMAMAAAGVFGVVALAVVLATTIHAADEPDIVETAAAQAEPAQSYRPLICPTFSDVSGSPADRSLCEKNLAKAERLHGMKSQQTAAAILDLAGYHAEWTESAKADPLFRRAIEAHDAAYGKNSARTALCLLVYADFLVKESRWREAVPLLERAVAIHERVSGPDHPETVLAVRSLGDVKDQLGDRAAAKALLDRERTSRKMILPQVAPTACDDPDYFRAHEHVGARLVQTGNIDAADYHFRRAIQLRPDLAENHNNLGVVLSYQSHINEAIDEFVEAKRLAPEVPAIAIHLANELTKAERYAEAEKEFKELLDKEPRNPALINNYGVALYKQGKREESIAQFKKALEIDPNLKDAQESLAVAVGEKPDPAAESPKPPPEE